MSVMTTERWGQKLKDYDKSTAVQHSILLCNLYCKFLITHVQTCLSFFNWCCLFHQRLFTSKCSWFVSKIKNIERFVTAQLNSTILQEEEMNLLRKMKGLIHEIQFQCSNVYPKHIETSEKTSGKIWKILSHSDLSKTDFLCSWKNKEINAAMTVHTIAKAMKVLHLSLNLAWQTEKHGQVIL
jgi:hypothetical protein